MAGGQNQDSTYHINSHRLLYLTIFTIATHLRSQLTSRSPIDIATIGSRQHAMGGGIARWRMVMGVVLEFQSPWPRMFRDLGLRSAIRRVGSSESKPFAVGFDSTGMAKTNASTKVNASVCANEVDSLGIPF